MTLSVLESLRVAVEAARDKKAQGIEVLELGEMTSVTDYFLICHGNSSRQVDAIVSEIRRKLRECKVRAAHVEGEGGSEWVLMDYLQFVVHVFTAERRSFYSLEKLWAGAPRVEFPEPAPPAQAGRSGS
jgi:ribosome-associated protein